MTDSTTPRTPMTHGYLRWIGVIGLADTFSYRASPCFRRPTWSRAPRAHAAAEPII
jgi:hypothetical protein